MDLVAGDDLYVTNAPNVAGMDLETINQQLSGAQPESGREAMRRVFAISKELDAHLATLGRQLARLTEAWQAPSTERGAGAVSVVQGHVQALRDHATRLGTAFTNYSEEVGTARAKVPPPAPGIVPFPAVAPSPIAGLTMGVAVAAAEIDQQQRTSEARQIMQELTRAAQVVDGATPGFAPLPSQAIDTSGHSQGNGPLSSAETANQNAGQSPRPAAGPLTTASNATAAPMGQVGPSAATPLPSATSPPAPTGAQSATFTPPPGLTPDLAREGGPGRTVSTGLGGAGRLPGSGGPRGGRLTGGGSLPGGGTSRGGPATIGRGDGQPGGRGNVLGAPGGSGAGAGRGSGAGAGNPAAKDQVATQRGAGARQGVAPTGGGPVGAGRGSSEDEDYEHQRAPFLRADEAAEELFGTDQVTAPPVIGGPDYY